MGGTYCESLELVGGASPVVGGAMCLLHKHKADRHVEAGFDYRRSGMCLEQ